MCVCLCVYVFYLCWGCVHIEFLQGIILWYLFAEQRRKKQKTIEPSGMSVDGCKVTCHQKMHIVHPLASRVVYGCSMRVFILYMILYVYVCVCVSILGDS